MVLSVDSFLPLEKDEEKKSKLTFDSFSKSNSYDSSYLFGDDKVKT